MAIDLMKASRSVARPVVAGALIAVGGTGFAFGPLAGLAMLGACVFLTGLAITLRLPLVF